jgi:hypothetical protein
MNFRGRMFRDNQFGKGSTPATDIDPSQTGMWRQPVKENDASEFAPFAYPPFISCRIIELDLWIGH